MLNKKWIFYFYCFLFSFPAFAKYQVCSITINSADEIEVFKEHLSPEKFEFVELLPQNKEHYKTHDSHWFYDACKKNYKCDILVISGHFGGTFFGKSGFTLPTELLEEQSCNKSCSQILSNVKEIFLFGCNTLSDKTKDTRTYEQYLKVLLDDGMARETAERVVAARYSPLGAPFHKRMNFIFSGSKSIYGFDQLSPLGKHISGSLKNYFKSINKRYGSYYKYIHNKSYERKENTELLTNLKHTTISQAYLPLITKDIKDQILFQNKCILFDNKVPFIKRAESLKNIFESDNSGSAFFAIEHFLGNYQSKMVEGEGREIFRNLKNNETFSQKFKSFYKHLNHLPYMKIVYLNILKRFQWIDYLELKTKMKESIVSLVKNPDSESYMSINLLIADNQLDKRKFFFTEKDLPKGYIKNIWSLLILEKLQYESPHLQQEILDFCYDNRKDKITFCYQSLNTLAHIKPKHDIALEVSNFLNENDNGLIFYTLRLLGQSPITNYSTHAKMATFLNHSEPWIRDEALDALLFIKTPHADIQEKLAEILNHSDTKLAERILSSFSQVNIVSEKAMSHIVYYIHENLENRNLFQNGIASFKSSLNLSDFTLDYFYKLLESKKDLSILYFTLETLSQMKIKDLGIYYRISQFYKEPDKKIRRSVLNHISSLNWFHPNVQSELVYFLQDESRKVRYLAVQLFKNIENLTQETVNIIVSLEGSNKEIDDLISFLRDK